jgi:hypothetical protein
MKNFDETQLTQFIGTTGYFRISRRHLLTDGTKYLGETICQQLSRDECLRRSLCSHQLRKACLSLLMIA